MVKECTLEKTAESSETHLKIAEDGGSEVTRPQTCDEGYFTDAFLDVFEVKQCTDEPLGPTNELHARLMFLPPAAPLVYGKWIDQGIGYIATGGDDKSYSDIIASDPWAAAPLVSFAVTANPLPGFAVYGLSKLDLSFVAEHIKMNVDCMAGWL